MGYSRLVKWIDWRAMKHGAPIVIVDPRKTSSECPQCESKLEENGYRRLRCPRCGFEEDRDVIGKLNIRKRALKMLGIKIDFGGVLAPLTAPQMTDVAPNRWGEPMIRPQRAGEPLPFQGGEEVSRSGRLLLKGQLSFWRALFFRSPTIVGDHLGQGGCQEPVQEVWWRCCR